MFLNFNVLKAFCFVSLASALVACAVKPTKKPSFRICAEPSNLPYSDQASHSGFEVEVAEVLAQKLNKELEVKWIAQRDHSYFRSTIGGDQCDAIMSVPAGFAKLTTTKPWYFTGFSFVTRSDLKLSGLDDRRLRKLNIGVPSTGLGETPPALALGHHGLNRQLIPFSIYEPKELVQAVRENKIDVAVLWGPFAGWWGQDLNVTPTPARDGELALEYEVAIGVKKGNLALKQSLESALNEEQAKIAEILKRWRVPLRGS